MFYHAYGEDAKLEGVDIEFLPCPFCGGKPEWLENPGNDYIMRCLNCHASTRTFRMEPEEAVYDWNNGDIENDNFSIDEDIKIDDYLAGGIKQIYFSEYSNLDEYWPVDNGFLCSDVVIQATESTIVLCSDYDIFHYRVINSFNRDVYKKVLAKTNEEINLIKSEWDGNLLLSLEFKCGDKTISVIADEEECTRVLGLSITN